MIKTKGIAGFEGGLSWRSWGTKEKEECDVCLFIQNMFFNFFYPFFLQHHP